jgi:hypothetical protein
MMLALVGTAMATNLGVKAPAKADVHHPVNIPSDDRQGGDTILDAVVVTLPVENGSGTTAGYNNDYDEVCPYTGSTAPDVVYTFTADGDGAIDVDLCGSSYDTKVYVYDVNLNLIACNDDFYFDDVCGVYVSKIENMPIMDGMQYYVIVDGYGTDFGDYVINIDTFEPCVVDCPAGGVPEGEPMLEDGYVDNFNGGCNSAGFPFQPVTADVFCGIAGWYVFAGLNYRDTDWFTAQIPDSGVLELNIVGEYEIWLAEIIGDCPDITLGAQTTVGPCVEGNVVIPGAVGAEVKFVILSTVFEGPVTEWNYVLNTNLITATEDQSWSAVKALF